MAISEIYVDPSIAGDSGTGTIGDPYGDLEYAIEQTTFDTTNGTRVNIKAGTDEVLAAELDAALADTSVSAAWTPSSTAPLVFQGYTSAAGDGGIGGINCNGVECISTARNYITFADLHIHNVTATWAIQITGVYPAVIRCQINDVTGSGINIGAGGSIMNCYLHDVSITGVNPSSGAYIGFNFFKNGTKTFQRAIQGAAQFSVIENNIISVGGASDGILVASQNVVKNNSIYSSAGTGQGITTLSAALMPVVMNNVVEGFSGTGGIGIELNVGNTLLVLYGGNAVYDCATAYAAANRNAFDYGDNETLSASPFTNAAGDDFSPVDTGNIKEGSLPQTFKTA